MTPSEQKPIIELSNISFSYGEREVLSHINLVINEGDYLGIVGPNGAGKTTLLKLILGLLMPSEGRITLFGRDRSNFRNTPLIGYVPQKTSSFDLNFPATVLEVVLMGRYAQCGLFHRICDDDKRTVKDTLEHVGMWEYRDRLIGQLSGGQVQRTFIARALASNPKVLFLDEPTAGIDHKAQEDFYALLRELRHDDGLTIVLISHDMETITKEASGVAYIDTTLSYYSSPALFFDKERTKEHAFIHGHDH